MIVCSRCGTQNSADAGACLLCGKAFSTPDAEPSAANAHAAADLGRTVALPRASTSTSNPTFNPAQTLAFAPDHPLKASPELPTTTQALGPGKTVVLTPMESAANGGGEGVLDAHAEPVAQPPNELAAPGEPAPGLAELANDADEPASVQAEPPTVGVAGAALPEPVPARTQLLGKTLALPGLLPNPSGEGDPSAPATPATAAQAGATGGSPGPLRSTVLGLGVPNLAQQVAQNPPSPPTHAGQTLAISPPFGTKPPTRTMLGIAPDGLLKPVAPPESKAGPQGDLAAGVPHTKTILGVARPGIAPMNPGVRKPDPVPETFPSPPPPPPLARDSGTPVAPVVPRDTGHQQPGARTVTLQAARKSSLAAIIAIAVAVLLLAASAALYFYLAGPEKIEARVVLDPEGRERILLRCQGCEDGTVVKLEGIETTFKAHQAELALQRTLKVGETPFSLVVRAPGAARENTVSLSVRIDYRVRADLAGLAEPTPRVRVLVDALPGSSVTVDDRPVTLSPAGQGSAEFDVSRELTGEDNTIRRLERRIGYAVLPPGGARQVGEVIVQLGIAPLVVDAPGETVTIETPTFVLAGRTVKGGSASVEGRALRVDPDGRFAQVMNVSSVGETTITLRAVAPDHAPRLFPIRVRRVTSFAEEAAKVRAQATTSYASIADNPEKKRDWKIALDGSVLERSNLEHSSLFLFEVTSGCRAAPCLARVKYGARSELVPGDRVSVFGRVVGAVDGPRRNTKIPEILADFVVKAKK